MSWDNYGQWHVDHKLPIASFNLKRRDHQLQCFHYTNLQPLWAIDNFKKNATVIPPQQFFKFSVAPADTGDRVTAPAATVAQGGEGNALRG